MNSNQQGELKKYWSYIKYMVYGMISKETRDKVLSLKTPDFFRIKHNGDKHANAVVMPIEVCCPYSGFFSIFECIIQPLIYAYQYHFIPIIKMGRSELYSEITGPYAELDLFDCFFCQPGSISYSELYECRYVVYPEGRHSNYFCYNGKFYDQSHQSTIEASLAFKTFIKLNDAVNKHFEKKIRELLEFSIFSPENKAYNILGVHVRGTDFYAQFDGHAIPANINQFIERVHSLFDTGKYKYIFLACDETKTIQEFVKVFGEAVKYHDVFRSDSDEKVGIHCLSSSRENHKYKLGLEVLLDMYSLSYCDALIATKSAVPYYAIVCKTSRSEYYDSIDIIDNGTYRTNKNSIKSVRNEYIKRNR